MSSTRRLSSGWTEGFKPTHPAPSWLLPHLPYEPLPPCVPPGGRNCPGSCKRPAGQNRGLLSSRSTSPRTYVRRRASRETTPPHDCYPPTTSRGLQTPHLHFPSARRRCERVCLHNSRKHHFVNTRSIDLPSLSLFLFLSIFRVLTSDGRPTIHIYVLSSVERNFQMKPSASEFAMMFVTDERGIYKGAQTFMRSPQKYARTERRSSSLRSVPGVELDGWMSTAAPD